MGELESVSPAMCFSAKADEHFGVRLHAMLGRTVKWLPGNGTTNSYAGIALTEDDNKKKIIIMIINFIYIPPFIQGVFLKVLSNKWKKQENKI